MSEIILTQYNGKILGPIAKVLGWIMNGIYYVLNSLFGIENIGLCIIILTLIIYACLFPLTYKQQKFSKLSQKMNPELQAIQKNIKTREIRYLCKRCRKRHRWFTRNMVFHRPEAVSRC